MKDLLYKEECYKIVGICMEVHRNLGSGFLEIVYKDALEIEFAGNGIPFERECKYLINYKGQILKHDYYADFVVFGKIILEIKAVKGICDEFIARTINYLKVSENRLAIIANFGESKFTYKRVIW